MTDKFLEDLYELRRECLLLIESAESPEDLAEVRSLNRYLVNIDSMIQEKGGAIDALSKQDRRVKACFRYRTAVIVGPWRRSPERAMEDAIAARQARRERAIGVHWDVDGAIQESICAPCIVGHVDIPPRSLWRAQPTGRAITVMEIADKRQKSGDSLPCIFA